MPLLSRIKSLIRNLFSRRLMEQDLDHELRAYLDQSIEEKRRTGMTATDAARAARMEFGGMEQVKEQVRQAKTGHMVEELLQDLRYGARTLSKNKSFTVVAVLALALGIGANTAMFSVVYGILVRPLPYAEAGRIEVVYERYFPRDYAFGTMCVRDFLMWQENNKAFEYPSLFRNQLMDIGGAEGFPEQVQAASVTTGFFPTLGVHPLIGRTFADGEDRPNGVSLAVLSEAIWRRRFHADDTLLGRTILVNGASTTVIGVMPAEFAFPRNDTEVWTNLFSNPPTRYGPYFYRGLARLKPGVTLAQAQRELNQIAFRMMQQNRDYQRLVLPAVELRDALLGTTLKPAILVLAGAVGLVLLIAIVNVANLMLARSTVRRPEMALRLSLGAGRARLLRQLLTESLLLAGMGGVAGLFLAWGAVEFIRAWNPGNLPLIDSVRLDPRVLGFTLLVCMLAGVLFGLAPALQSAHADLDSSIKDGGRGGGASRTGGRTRAALVISEVSISVMLLIGAGLLLRSFANLEKVSAGFSTPPNQILRMVISPGSRRYSDGKAGLAFYEEVLRRARGVPGVETAAVTDSLPPDMQGDADTFVIEGQRLAPGEMNPIVSVITAGPEFFGLLKIPLLRGRAFSEHDGAESAPVTIVSEGFARRFFPNQDVLGKRIQQSSAGFGNRLMEIVGVVGNVKYLGLTVDTDPAYYMPFAQSYGPRMFLVARTRQDASHLAETLRREIQSIDRDVTLAGVSTLEQGMQRALAQPRFDTMLLTLFAGIALSLAAVGIYGLIAYSVAQRTHEIGVRMALGAARVDVLRMVARQSAWLAMIGIVTGLCGAFALTRLLRTMLFGIGVTDAVTFVMAGVGIIIVVLLATLVPARRATRISPLIALRYE